MNDCYAKTECVHAASMHVWTPQNENSYLLHDHEILPYHIIAILLHHKHQISTCSIFLDGKSCY